MPKTIIPGRIAFRVEGNMWNCYFAKNETMDGAILMGSIAMAFVQREERKQAFMDLMKDIYSDFTEETMGARATYPDEAQPAPEHERSGHA